MEPLHYVNKLQQHCDGLCITNWSQSMKIGRVELLYVIIDYCYGTRAFFLLITATQTVFFILLYLVQRSPKQQYPPAHQLIQYIHRE